jgi:S-DNA-T family DNA segregation ATPase FtsK/SpoIIIE
MSTKQKDLELQSDRIEMVLANYKAPARVTGGVVTPRMVQFHLAPAAGTRINKVQGLADELALALGVTHVRVSRRGGNVQLEVPHQGAGPGAGQIKLLSLMARLDRPLPPGTATLGLCDDGAPLLIRLPSPDVAHILVSGTTGSGKTALCQTIILSLAMTHRRSQLQFVLVDPKRRAFAPFAALPHLMWPVISDAADAIHALGELVRLMESRGSKEASGVTPAFGTGASVPRIIVVMDELADLIQMGGRALGAPLTRLAQRGREAGIHVIACTQKPSSQVVGALVRANFPVRLVGKVVSPEDARVAAGIGGTGAEKLAGHGDFIAVASGQVLRFQAAYVGLAEMEQVVAQMGSSPRLWDILRGRPSLLRETATST